MTEQKTHASSGAPRISGAERLARKTLRDSEGRVAMADYQRDQLATLDRTAKLKALRLAQEEPSIKAKPEKSRKKIG